MCNNSLFDGEVRRKCIGAKRITEDVDAYWIRPMCVVGEHSVFIEARPVRARGGYGRENVGMSNHNPNEKLEPRKSKVSVALAINHGLGGPKAMAKAAADGKLVNIPARPHDHKQRTKETNIRALMVWRALVEEVSEANPAYAARQFQAKR